MGETAHGYDRLAIPSVASLRVDPERMEQLWAMRPQERVAAAMAGRFTLGEMLRWASRFPSEPPIVEGEVFFITALTVDAAAESPSQAQRFWDGEYTPMPETGDAPLPAPADPGHMSRGGSR